ncbi:DUF3173 domain-containing protein [Limosilactobacillus reuteri]|nr:DUF3173 domain-containing protein [Limosilactobacillus reuteri]
MITMVKSVVTKQELEKMGFKPNQAKNILHTARQVMVKNGKKYWANPRLQVAPRAIIEDVILGIPLESEDHK